MFLLSDVVFFLQTQLQQITMQEIIFGELALVSLTFGSYTSPIDTFSFTYHFLYMSIPHQAPQLQPHLRGRQFPMLSITDQHLQ